LKSLVISFFSGMRSLLRHTLYTRLLTLLLCLVITIVLMQAGALFLVDYIPNAQEEIQKIREQQLFWKYHLDMADAQSLAKTEDVLERLTSRNLNSSDPALAWLGKLSDASFGERLKGIRSARSDFSAAMTHASLTEKISAARKVEAAYSNLADAIERDMEMRQSVISLLQLVGLLLVMSCIAAIGLGARRVLLDRLDHLLSLVPPEFAKDVLSASTDEFVRLERMFYEIASRLEGFKAETQWVNQSSGERIRRLIRSQDFLIKFVELINTSTLSEMTLRKILYSLERTLDVNNVALIFPAHDSESGQRVLFSQYPPSLPQRELIEDAEGSVPIEMVMRGDTGVSMRCLVVAFSGANDELAILKIEADEGREFEDAERNLVEVTAQLLAMIMGIQSREQEGRRVALLEERAAIARELHDSLAQSLSFMKIQLSRLQSSTAMHGAGSEIQGILDELRQGLDGAYKELRELLTTFRVHMDVRGLGTAIQTAIDEFTQRSSLAITLDNRLVNCRLTVNEEFHILHVVREALANIVRHAGASNVVIALVFQSNGTVMVTIDDDGVGYIPAQGDEPHHYGQTIMKERAFSLGGEIQVMARRKGGTRVRLVFTPKLAQ
jgi:two-component system nitrate/nitrite sensor histidine kinase NarX